MRIGCLAGGLLGVLQPFSGVSREVVEVSQGCYLVEEGGWSGFKESDE